MNKKKYIRTTDDAWTKSQISQLRNLYPIANNAVIAAMIDKTTSAVRSKAAKLGLKKAAREWPEKDKKYLIKNVDKKSYEQIALHLGRTRWSVINKYRELMGLRSLAKNIKSKK